MFNVFVVDDEPPLVRSMSRKVENSGLNFMVCGFAYNGTEAMQKIQNLDVDVLLTDIRMPVMDGLALISAVKEAYPNIIPIIISAYKDFEYAKTAMQLGAADYLLKPIDSEQFNRAFKRIEEMLSANRVTPDEETSAFLTKIDFMLTQNDKNGLSGALVQLGLFLKESKKSEQYSSGVITQVCGNISRRLGIKFSSLPENAPAEESFAFIADIISDNMDESEIPAKETLKLMNQIDNYIQKNIGGIMTLPDICQDLHVSQPHLSRVIRTYRDRSFTEYATFIRMRKAREILRAVPDAMIKDVAKAIGYEDQHYFSKVFKTIVGVTPSEFKDNPGKPPD